MAQTIGEQLSQAREKRGLTLEQAAEETHIRVHFLQALETDQRGALPSNVQGRGFLRLYASLLELPVAPLLAAWDSAGQPGEVLTQAAVPPIQPAPPVATEAEEPQPDGFDPEPQPDSQPYIPEDLDTGPAVVYEAPSKPLPAEQDPGDQNTNEISSSAIFAEIGQKLRDQREGLGLSLAEVERYTRLRGHYIQALEAGNLNDLPSPVQGRGMLSNYASFLNMDEQRLLLRFAEGLQARRIERQPKPEPPGVFSQKKRPARQATVWRRFLTPDLLFGVGVAVIILFFALWSASRINALRTTRAEPTPIGVAEFLLTPDATNQTPGTPGAESTFAVIDGTAQPTAESTVDPQSAGESVVGTPVVALPQATDTPPGTATLPPMNSDSLQVYIISRQRAYLKVVTDDTVKFLGRTVPGNAYAFSGDRRIELSTGNSAALQVFFNQTDLGTLGLAGEVTNLVFTSDGYATPTSAFTSTPTPTQLATITPLPSATPTTTPTITPFVP